LVLLFGCADQWSNGTHDSLRRFARDRDLETLRCNCVDQYAACAEYDGCSTAEMHVECTDHKWCSNRRGQRLLNGSSAVPPTSVGSTLGAKGRGLFAAAGSDAIQANDFVIEYVGEVCCLSHRLALRIVPDCVPCRSRSLTAKQATFALAAGLRAGVI